MLNGHIMPGKKGKSGGSRPNSGAKKGPALVSAHFLILPAQKEWLAKQGNRNETVRRLIQEAINREPKPSQNTPPAAQP